MCECRSAHTPCLFLRTPASDVLKSKIVLKFCVLNFTISPPASGRSLFIFSPVHASILAFDTGREENENSNNITHTQKHAYPGTVSNLQYQFVHRYTLTWRTCSGPRVQSGGAFFCCCCCAFCFQFSHVHLSRREATVVTRAKQNHITQEGAHRAEALLLVRRILQLTRHNVWCHFSTNPSDKRYIVTHAPAALKLSQSVLPSRGDLLTQIHPDWARTCS